MSEKSTAQEILECAKGLIMKGGYNGFSYADISKAVGIRNASIHHHFPSKADLVKVLVANYREGAEKGLAGLELQSKGPMDLLRAYVAIWEKCITDGSHPMCVCALLAGEIPALPSEVAAEVRAYFRFLSSWLTSVIGKAAAEGEAKFKGSAKQEAEGFMATIHGAMMSARAFGDTKAFGRVAQPLITRLVK